MRNFVSLIFLVVPACFMVVRLAMLAEFENYNNRGSNPIGKHGSYDFFQIYNSIDHVLLHFILRRLINSRFVPERKRKYGHVVRKHKLTAGEFI